MLQKLFAHCQEWLARPHFPFALATSLVLEFRRHPRAPLWQSVQNLLARVRPAPAAPPLTENFYRLVARHAPEGWFVVNRVLQFVEVNDSFCRMWGMSRKEIFAHTLPEILAEVDCEAEFFSDLLACRAGRGELTITPEPGPARVLELETAVLTQELFLGCARDMTERKQREEEMRRAAEWRALLLRSLTDGMALIDCTGRVLLCNRAFETAFALSAHALQDLSLFKPYVQTPARQCVWALCDAHGTPLLGAENPFYRAAQLQQRVNDYRMQLQPQGRTLSLAAAPLHDEHNTLLGAVITVRDISARAQQEEEQQRTRSLQQQAACFAAQRTLARDLAPAIEDPSCGIALYAQLLMPYLPQGSEEAVLARGILQETHALLEVIRELRALAKTTPRPQELAKPRRSARKTALPAHENLPWPLAVN